MLKVAASLEQINQFTLTWMHRSSFRRFWPTHRYSPLLLSQKSPWSTSCPPHPVLAPWSPDKWAMSSVSYPRHWERCNILNCTGLQRWPVVSCVVKTSVWKQRKQYLLWDKTHRTNQDLIYFVLHWCHMACSHTASDSWYIMKLYVCHEMVIIFGDTKQISTSFYICNSKSYFWFT